MRSTAIGTALLSLSVAFALASVLFSNISWAVLSISFVAVVVYSRLRFVADIERTDIEVKRTVLDEIVFSDEPISVKLELINKGQGPVKGTFEDVLPADCTLHGGDNRVTHMLPSRSILTINYSIVPKKRGAHNMPGLRLERTDGFGLFTDEQFIEHGTYIGAHTRREVIDRARKIAGKEHFEFSGFARNPAVVLREFEFDGIREYLPGDRVRDIQWKLLPKLNKLMTKIYKKEGAVQTVVFIDCGRSMRMETAPVSKIDHALDLAMQISNVLISSFHPAGVATFDELKILDQVPPSLGRHQFEKIIKVVSSVPETIKKSAEAAPAASRPEPEQETRTALRSANGDASSKEFLTRLESLPGTKRRPGMGLGLEGAVKTMVAHSKGQEQLFIIISDLGSSREAVFTVAKVCQRTGNKMLMIHAHDDFYGLPEGTPTVGDVERMYTDLEETIKQEAGLRALGAAYIRIGPADTATGIVRAIRRGKA